MSDDQSHTQELVAQYPTWLIETYCIVAASALLWFDYALTLPGEYRRIWRRKFTGATLIFLLMRYATLIERIPFVLEVLVWNSSDRECGVLTHMDDILTLISYLATAAFTTLRVYSIWGRDWKPLVLAVPVSFYSSFALTYESVRYTPTQGGPLFGCYELSYVPDILLSTFSTTSKTATLASTSIVILLTWVKTFSIVRHSWKTGFSTPLATFLMRDGTAYFLALVACQLLPLITSSVVSFTSMSHYLVFLVWPIFSQILTVIIHSRFMLDLRGIYFADSGDEESELPSHWSGINFRGVSSIVVGNLGATLDTTPGSAPNPHDSSAALQDSTGGECESEWEDEAPKYCDDPFTTGMKGTASSNVAQRVTQDSETTEIETPAIEQSPV